MKTKYVTALGLALAVSSLTAAEKDVVKEINKQKATASFLDKFNIAPVGVYSISPSGGNSAWQAGLDVGWTLNKYVQLEVSLLANEADNWGGTAIDETPINVTSQLFSGAGGKLKLNSKLGASRSWSLDDWALQGGGELEYSFNKNWSMFGGAQYQVWKKHEDRLVFPFGIGYKF